MKKKLNLIDSRFAHAPSSSWYNITKDFEWSRNIVEESDNIVITNLHQIEYLKNKKVFGWIIEPPSLEKGQYEFAKTNYNRFQKIFTYDKELLSVSDKFEFLPIGGCWIEEKDWTIHTKTKLVCSISSFKTITEGHRMRHEVTKKFPIVDTYGNGYIAIDKKIDVLKNYMFSVVIENEKRDYLFTEKLIDCFLTGTIPIYRGCPSISKFFDIDGFFIFDTIEELEIILNSINEDVYYKKMDFLKKNLELSKKYTIADNLIFDKLNSWGVY
jgi:hypothetical protein